MKVWVWVLFSGLKWALSGVDAVVLVWLDSAEAKVEGRVKVEAGGS